MAKLSNVIIHCSDSEWGCAAEIRRWHLANGWNDIGYHFVITNGIIVPQTNWETRLYLPCIDGSIEIGRKLDGDRFVKDNELGAHALGYNDKSIGICLIGTKSFTAWQFKQLAELIVGLEPVFGVSRENILGHYQVSKNRTCPNFDVPLFVSDIYTIANGILANVTPDKYKKVN